MKTLITVAPATYRGGMQTIAYPYTALYCVEVEAKNADELTGALSDIREQIKENAAIFVKPLTRKFSGFDKWKNSNRHLFQIDTTDNP
jgi:hypothetical protein